MLVLDRRIGETVIIDGKIVVKILGRRGNQIRLGVQAPKEVIVNRQEVHDLLFGNACTQPALALCED